MCKKNKESEKREAALKLRRRWMEEIKETEKKEKDNEKQE
jgi:hypothetical protein